MRFDGREKPQKGLRKRQNNKMALLAAGLAGLCLCTLLAAVLLNENAARKAQPGAVSGALAAQQGAGSVLAPASSDAAALPPASPEVAPAPPAAPPVELPSLVAPEDGWPPYAFSAEEIAGLDTLLNEWAALSPAPAQTQAGEEGAESAANSAAEEAKPDEENGHRVAVYFKDLDSGAEYIYGGEEKFDVASLSKAPYAMYLYRLVEQGQASLDETFLIDAEAIKGSEENSGKLKSDPNLPRELSLAEMIEYLLRYSDTVAQRVLLKRYPAEGYAAFAAGLGLHNPADVRGVTSGLITAPDAGVYLAALKDYMDTGVYGKELQAHLMNTRNAMLRTPWPMARKYGWDTFAYHDMAVVYAPHPYLIAILSDKSDAAAEDLAYFTTLPAAFEQLMARHWADAELGPNTKMGV